MSKLLRILNLFGVELPIWTFDFETYWEDKSKGYSLKNKDLTTTLYVRDPRFKAHGCSIVTPDRFSLWITNRNLPKFFNSINWSENALLAQNCLTGDHEVLTPDGWVRLDKLSGNEKVAQWDPETGYAEFVEYKPVKKWFKGNMLMWDSQYHKGIYTPDHRFYYSTPNVNKWRVLTANEISNLGPNNVYIPSAANKLINNEDSSYFITENEARLIEAFRADGSWRKTNKVYYGWKFKFTKERKCERIESLLNTCNVAYSKKKKVESYKGSNITCFIYNICSCNITKKARNIFTEEKSYGRSILKIPTSAQKAILDELKWWDGSHVTDKNSYTFSTADNNTAYWIQILAVLNGYGYKYSVINNARGFNKNNAGATLNVGTLRNKNKVKTLYKPKYLEHNGYVYCINVPSKAFIVRRNGATWITGNCYFDALIANEYYGVKAGYYLDTMSMSYAEWGPRVSGSLAAICKRLKLKGKIKGALEPTANIRDLSCEQERALVPYAIQDSEQTLEAFLKMYKEMGFPENELHIIDQTIKAYVDPTLNVNRGLCEAEIEEEKIRLENLFKSDLIQGAELSKKCKAILETDRVEGLLRSRNCFAELLESRGVSSPLKHAKDQHGQLKFDENNEPIYTYAFAKDDIELQNLGEDPRVSDLVAAWTGSKSTIRRTRAESFLKHSNNGTKPMPVPLKYCGAHTFRWSGWDDINLQNLPSGRDGRGSRLREAIEAPPGYVLCVADSSQVECRQNTWLWDQDDLLNTFKEGGDPYADIASDLYKVPVVKDGENNHLRFVGKAMELGLGFGMGPNRFLDGCLSGGLIGKKIPMTIQEAERNVYYWRDKRYKIVKGWDILKNAINKMCAGIEPGWIGPMYFETEAVIMPNGLKMHYRKIHWRKIDEKYQVVFESQKNRRGESIWTRIWGSKMDENLVQSLARIIVAEQALEIAKKYKIVLLVHDEVVYLAPEKEADEALEFGLNCLRTPLEWCPNIPLDAEGGYAKNYVK